MTIGFPFRLAAAAGLGLLLTGCIDADVDIEVVSETDARTTLTQTMSAEFYPMVKESTQPGDAEAFCADGTLTENPDDSATCVITEQGSFADLTLGAEGEDTGVTFTPAGPGLVRVAISTAEMAAEVGAGEELDAETQAMVEGFFTGHDITITISGTGVTETNMDQVDGAAQTVIPILDLINGDIELPDELYAVVRVN